MSIRKEWSVTEKRLIREADSLGQLLDQYKELFPRVLIGGQEWTRLLEHARELPASIAAYPLMFDLPLHEHRPRANLGVSVVGGTGPATFFKEKGRCENVDPSVASIARLLYESEPEKAPLRQVVGQKMVLEYEIDSPPSNARPVPGIFLRPAERPIVGDGSSQRIQDIGVMLEAIVAAFGWNPDIAERRQVEQVYSVLNTDARIDSLGAYPSRERAIHLAVTGFRTSHDVTAFLGDAGWSGPHPVVAATVSRFEEHSAFINLGVHFDVSADGLNPTLGLSFLAKERDANDPRYWLDSTRQWTSFIDGLRDEGLAIPEKLSALTNWLQGPTALFGKSGVFVLLRGIHHIMLVLTGDRIKQVRGYVFMVVLGAPST